MKIAALLRDSYREAVDRKIFAAMLVLSGLLALFVASISYRMITVEDELSTAASQLTWGMGFNPHMKKPTYAIENFRQTNNASEPWRGDYRFDWVVKSADADSLKQTPMSRRFDFRQFMRQGFDYLKDVEISENVSTETNQARFEVTTHGTTVEDALAWRYEPKILFAVPLPIFHTSMREAVYFVESTLVSGLGAWVAVLIGVVVTASFIPDLLRKGSIDLILAKPIRRPSILFYKYLGGLAFVFLLTAATVLSVWTAIGVRSGIWSPGFLLVIPAVTFYFALLYSVSTLTAVLTRSAVVSILLTCAVWFGFWLNTTAHNFLEGVRKAKDEGEAKIKVAVGGGAAKDDKDKDPDNAGEEDQGRRRMDIPSWVYTTSNIFYKVLPRTGEMNNLTSVWIGRGVLSDAEFKTAGLEKVAKIAWGETIGVTSAFILLMLGLACWKFARVDY